MTENTTDLVCGLTRKIVIVFIDETNTGGVDQGPEYVVGASVMNDSFFEYNKALFENITRERFRALTEDVQRKKKELKFSEDRNAREPVLKDISKLRPDLYAVTVTKPKEIPWTKNQQRDVHRNAVCRLIREILKNEQGNDIDLTVDKVDKLGSGTLEDMRNMLAMTHEGELTFRIGNSQESFGLQTNDFAIGAMGKKYNRGEEKWMNCLRTATYRIPLTGEEALKDTGKRSAKKQTVT